MGAIRVQDKRALTEVLRMAGGAGREQRVPPRLSGRCTPLRDGREAKMRAEPEDKESRLDTVGAEVERRREDARGEGAGGDRKRVVRIKLSQGTGARRRGHAGGA